MDKSRIEYTELFKGSDDRLLTAVAEKLNAVALPAGGDVFREGDAAGAFYIIESGSVAIIRESPSETPVELARLGAGAFFGEMGPLTNKPRGATVRCTEATVLLELGKEDFLALVAAFPLLGMKLRAIAMRRRSQNLTTSQPK